MKKLSESIREYQKQVEKGDIVIAYRSIMTFMSKLRSYLGKKYPFYSIGNLYMGYMDMTYLPIIPVNLKREKLKIALVFLHKECRFEIWLSGANRGIQSKFVDKFTNEDLGNYTLSKVAPGIDSIIQWIVVDEPDFDNQHDLINIIDSGLLTFIEDISILIKNP